MSTQAKSIKGSYCRDCKVFCSDTDPEAMKMVKELLDNPHSEGNKVRIMPDVHLGKGIVIGFTGLMGTHVNPSHIGLDIGCAIAIINFFVDDRWENECYELSPKSRVILKTQIDVINEYLEKNLVPADELQLAKLALENASDIMETALPYNGPKTNS